MEINNSIPCNKGNYTYCKNRDIRYIVMHYTGNYTDTAKANCNFFQSDDRNASAHYFVDKNSIYQSVQDNCIAWSVGKYFGNDNRGGGSLWRTVNNDNSISIEMCSDNGTFHKDTLNNAAELVVQLLKKYNLPIDRVVTHYLVCNKPCPKYWLNNNGLKDFKELVKAKMNGPKIDDELYEAVSKIIKNGYSIDINCWKRKDLMNLEYVPSLLDKLGGIDALVSKGVIEEVERWKTSAYTEDSVRWLLIKFAKTL